MEDLDAFTAWIEECADRLAVGDRVPPRGGCDVEILLRNTARRGAKARSAIGALRVELRSAAAQARKRCAVSRLASFRLLLAAGFALAGRTWLTAGDLAPSSVSDAACLALAAALATAFQVAVRRVLPRSWIWRDGLTPDGLRWLAALLGERVAPASIQATLDRLRADEVRRGFSRSEAREAALLAFARNRTEADTELLSRFEAAWPLAELVGIGLPVLLVLAGRLAV